MNIRQITEKDLVILTEWCSDWDFPDIGGFGDLLPSSGFIVSDKDIDIIAGFLYLTDSAIAHPEWIVSNKSYRDKEKKIEAKRFLFKEFERCAKNNNKSMLIMGTDNKFLIRDLVRDLGFSKTDSNITHLTKII